VDFVGLTVGYQDDAVVLGEYGFLPRRELDVFHFHIYYGWEED
jgi:hypothetical protein